MVLRRWSVVTAAHHPVLRLQGGARMPAWYDIEGFGIDRKLREYSGIEDSAARIRGLIKAEVEAGIPTNRIALAGFSQGGAMSLCTGLTHAETLGGIIAISGHLPLQDQVAPPAAALATPVFQGHGDKVSPRSERGITLGRCGDLQRLTRVPWRAPLPLAGAGRRRAPHLGAG